MVSFAGKEAVALSSPAAGAAGAVALLAGHTLVPGMPEAASDSCIFMAMSVFLAVGIVVMCLDVRDIAEEEARKEATDSEPNQEAGVKEPPFGDFFMSVLVAALVLVLGVVLATNAEKLAGLHEPFSPTSLHADSLNKAALADIAALVFDEPVAWRIVACRTRSWCLAAALSNELLIFLLSGFLLLGAAFHYSDYVDIRHEEEDGPRQHVSAEPSPSTPSKKHKMQEAAFHWRYWTSMALLVAVIASAAPSLLEGQ
jgi:hypothetical protein